MKKGFLLAIDIGTSGVKVAVYDINLNLTYSVVESYPTFYPQKGFAEQNPNHWWKAIVKAINKLSTEIEIKDILGIGIDGQSWSMIPIDKYGKVLYNNPIWFDTRAQEICDEINKTSLSQRLFDCGKNAISPTYTLPKVLWLKKYHKDIYNKTYKFLQSNSFIVYKLTGIISQDYSQSYGYQFFDESSLKYNEELINALGLDKEKFPEPVACSCVVGETTLQIQDLLGIKQGTPVIAGGLDAACGTLGVGVTQKGETQEQSGQAGGMSICMDEPIGDEKLILSPHVLPNKWLLQGGTTGGAGVLRWLEREFQCHNCYDEGDFNSFLQGVDDIPSGSEGLIFLPYMAGERSPIWESNAKGVFYGLDFSKTKFHIIRSALEGVAFSLKHNLDVAKQHNIVPNQMIASGGATKSKLWMQIKSDVTDTIIKVTNGANSTTLGVAILIAVAIGIYNDFGAWIKDKVEITKTYWPDKANKCCLDKNYEKYLILSDLTKEL